MHFSTLLALVPLTGASLVPPTLQNIFSNPQDDDQLKALKIPTSYESAVLGRRILSLTPHATLSTVFPNHQSSTGTNADVGGVPIGLPDYIADCEDAGNPTILAITIATSFRNVAAGSNISVSLEWVPPHPPSSRIGSTSTTYSAANLPRFSLIGYLEPISPASYLSVAKCFVETHQDAKYWLPGNPVHHSEWVRLVVQKVYWVGGFGDRAYIGWIPVEEWKNVTSEEIEDVRLPGEKKGWKEWAIEIIGGSEL